MSFTIKKLAQEGRLGPGDLIQHERLGECRVAYVQDAHSIVVQCTATGKHYNFSGISFGPDARVVDRTPMPGR